MYTQPMKTGYCQRFPNASCSDHERLFLSLLPPDCGVGVFAPGRPPSISCHDKHYRQGHFVLAAIGLGGEEAGRNLRRSLLGQTDT